MFGKLTELKKFLGVKVTYFGMSATLIKGIPKAKDKIAALI
jgi:hypothetical protein